MSLGTEITGPNSAETLATVGENAHLGDNVTRWGNQAYEEGNFLELPGTVDNDFSVSFDVALSVPGEQSWEFKGRLTDGGAGYICGIWPASASKRQNLLLKLASNAVRVYWYDETLTQRFYDSTPLAAKYLDADITLVAMYDPAGNVTLTAKLDGEAAETFLDQPFIGTNINDGNTTDGPVGGRMAGRIYSVKFAGTGAPTLDIDFSAFTRNATTGTALTGQTVTINQDGDPYAIITAEQAVTDATQIVATDQPVYYPKGDDGTYAYISLAVDSFLESDPFSLAGDFEITAVADIANPTGAGHAFLGGTATCLFRRVADKLEFWGDSVRRINKDIINPTNIKGYRVTRVGSTLTLYTSQDGETWEALGTEEYTGLVYTVAATYVGTWRSVGGAQLDGKIHRVLVVDDGTPVLDINIPVDATHLDTSFTATVGGTVTVNGDAKVIGHSVLSYDGINDHMTATLTNALTGGTMVAASSLGVAIYEVDLPAGAWSFDVLGTTAYDPQPGEVVSIDLYDHTFTDEEKEKIKAYYVARGAGNFSGVTDASYFWRERTDIVGEFPLIDLSNAENLSHTFRGCSSMTALPAFDLRSMTDANAMCVLCTSLVTFPAGVFDNWSPVSVENAVFNAFITSCPALSAESVENILVSIDTSGVWGTYSGVEGGTQLGDHTIDIGYDGSSLTPATLTAITNLEAKDWLVAITP